jgi:hypothetical protein
VLKATMRTGDEYWPSSRWRISIATTSTAPPAVVRGQGEAVPGSLLLGGVTRYANRGRWGWFLNHALASIWSFSTPVRHSALPSNRSFFHPGSTCEPLATTATCGLLPVPHRHRLRAAMGRPTPRRSCRFGRPMTNHVVTHSN